MVAYLQKSEGSEEQFWQTATASTLENRDMEITATINGKVKLVFKASIRRHLKLEYSNGISDLPTIEIFEQLALMGYVSNSDKLTFQRGHFSPQWRFLIHTILHCLSSKKTDWEQFSSNIVTAIICLATNRTFNFSKLIFDGMVKNLDSKTKFFMYPRFIQIFFNKHKRLLLPHKRLYIAPTLTQKLFSNMKRVSKGYTRVDTPLFQTMLVQGQILLGEGSTIPVESHHTPIVSPSTLQPHHSPTLRDFIRQETEVSQPSSLTQTHVADEAASTGVDVRHGGATTTVSNLDAGQGSGNIDKTPTMTQDSPLPRVHILGSDEGRMQHNESMDLVTKLSDRVVSLETDLQQINKVYGVAYTKLIKKGRKIAQINEDEGITKVQIGVQTQGRHDHEMDANFEFTTTKDVSTANVSVNTTGAEISTASPKVKTAGVFVDDVAAKDLMYIKRSAAKGKDKEESQRITSVHEEASTFKLKEWDNIQAQIEADEELAHRCNYIKHMGSHTLQQLRGYSFDEIKVLFEATVKSVNTFTPIDTTPKVVARSSKRSVEEELGEESSKRQKIGEGSEPTEESKDK
ncbi:hypothetical protein Tco_0836664 [Tanacetum coccineum]